MAATQGEKAAAKSEKAELKNLAPYALKSRERREKLGAQFREHKTAPLEYRTEYQRDRDRIVWSRAFKRLQHKTQVFPHYSEDHYRRRLTHSLEVAQIATTLARALNLNEDATEAIALAHDIGHPPFGHAGEIALDEALREQEWCLGDRCKNLLPLFGFDHCPHGVEVVSRVEREYQVGPHPHYGLNLTFDVRDGILKHIFDKKNSAPDRPLSHLANIVRFDLYKGFRDNKGSLEAQCVYFADKVAYLFGDMEDGLRRGILEYRKIASDEFIKLLWKRYTVVRRRKGIRLQLTNMEEYLPFRRDALATLILNCIETTRKEIRNNGFDSPETVLAANARVVYVDKKLSKEWESFYKRWMVDWLFKDKDVTACEVKGKKIVRELFDAYWETPELVDRKYHEHSDRSYREAGVKDDEVLRLIMVRNYIAGMTDAFAANQHKRLFMSSEPITFA